MLFGVSDMCGMFSSCCVVGVSGMFGICMCVLLVCVVCLELLCFGVPGMFVSLYVCTCGRCGMFSIVCVWC